MRSSYRPLQLWAVATVLLLCVKVDVVAWSPYLSSSSTSRLRNMIGIKRAAAFAWSRQASCRQTAFHGSTGVARKSIHSQVAAQRLWMSTDTNSPAEKTEEEKAAAKAAREARK